MNHSVLHVELGGNVMPLVIRGENSEDAMRLVFEAIVSSPLRPAYIVESDFRFKKREGE